MEVIKEKKQFNKNNNSIKALKEKQLRVVAYARVSTLSDNQATSFVSQQKYYKKKISSNPNWTLINIYADDGISGTKIFKRDAFKKMIIDGINDKYDLILTKSVSRFARNTVDTLEYVRILKDKGIGVIFEEENINTLDMNSELILTILSSIAQQEAQNLSNHVILGLQMKAKSGGIIGATYCYGYNYNKETKNFEINEEKAKVVRKIYEMYLEGYGTLRIAKYLSDNNISTPTNKKIWNEGSVTHILRNEKYKGDMLLGKRISVDPISKKAKVNTGERDKYYIRNHHPAIIDEETWNKVQVERDKRVLPYQREKNYYSNKKYSFSSKLVCGYCNKTLTRFKEKSCRNAKYYCHDSLRGFSSLCESKMQDEEIIKKAFMQMAIKLRRKINNTDKFNENVKSKIKYIRKVLLNRDDLDIKKYDEELFKDIIKYVIIGEKDKPFTMRFILNAEEDLIFKERKKKSCNLYKILEFESKQIFYYMDKLQNGKTKQVFVSSFRVTCEIDLGEEDGNYTYQA